MSKNTIGIFKAIWSGVWKYLLCFILGALVMSNCGGGCNHLPMVIKTETSKADRKKLDSLKFQNDIHLYTIKVLKKKVAVLDSISKIIKPIYRKAKKDNRDYIQNNPCDSVGILLAYDATVAKCDTVILTDSVSIATLKSENMHLENVVSDLAATLQIKENQLIEKDNEVAVEQRKTKVQKRKKIVATITGVLAVIATAFALK